MSVNKVILLGHLGSDAEVRYLNEGRVVANVSLATNEYFTDNSGNRIEQTEWHRLEMWDKLAKLAEQYLKKGRQVYVEGKLRTETWTDKEGIQRSTTRVRVLQLELLSGGPQSETPKTQENKIPLTRNEPQTESFNESDLDDEGLPF